MKKLFGIICCVTLMLACASALAEIRINDANFPDKNFQKYVEENFDTDGNGVLSEGEIAAVTNFGIVGRHIKNMKGLEFFTALEGLNVNDNDLTSLDLSKNTALKWLDCSNNQLASLDVSKNPQLDNLDCSENKLTSLDLTQNTKLTELKCRHNQLKTLDTSGCALSLTYLDCGDNQLTKLDVSGNTRLRVLSCDANELTSLELGRNDNMCVLECADNNLKNLDVRNCNNLNLLGQLVEPHHYTYEYGWYLGDAGQDPRFNTGGGDAVWINSDYDMHLTVGSADKAHKITSADCLILDEITFEEVTSALSGAALRIYLNPEAKPDEGKYFTGEFRIMPDALLVQPVDYIAQFTMPNHDVTVTAVQADLKDAQIDLTGSGQAAAEVLLLSELSLEAKTNLSGTEDGYNFYLDLNNDGIADVACSYGDGISMGAMKRLPGADKLTQDYTITLDTSADNMAPYRSVKLKIAKGGDAPDPQALINKRGNVTGDADGIVDGRDLLRLARYIAGNDVEINQTAADMNGDGTVDGRDLLRLAKHLAGQI